MPAIESAPNPSGFPIIEDLVCPQNSTFRKQWQWSTKDPVSGNQVPVDLSQWTGTAQVRLDYDDTILIDLTTGNRNLDLGSYGGITLDANGLITLEIAQGDTDGFDPVVGGYGLTIISPSGVAWPFATGQFTIERFINRGGNSAGVTSGASAYRLSLASAVSAAAAAQSSAAAAASSYTQVKSITDSLAAIIAIVQGGANAVAAVDAEYSGLLSQLGVLQTSVTTLQSTLNTVETSVTTASSNSNVALQLATAARATADLALDATIEPIATANRALNLAESNAGQLVTLTATVAAIAANIGLIVSPPNTGNTTSPTTGTYIDGQINGIDAGAPGYTAGALKIDTFIPFGYNPGAINGNTQYVDNSNSSTGAVGSDGYVASSSNTSNSGKGSDGYINSSATNLVNDDAGTY